MRHLDRHHAAIEVVQFVGDDDGRCSYLVACGNTRAAALIEPDPSMAAAYERAIDASGLRLRAVLDTHERTEDPPALWASVPRVGPTDDDQLAAGNHILNLALGPNGVDHYTIWGSSNPPLPNRRYFPVLVAFGAFKIRVIALVGLPGRVVYHVEDRLFTGLDLHGHPGTLPTPASLFDLPDHTIVYPGQAWGSQSISIVGAERRAATLSLEPAVVPLRSSRAPAAPVLRIADDPPEDLPEAAVEPMDYWTALETGRQFLHESRFAEARASFEAALAERPGDSIATQNLQRLTEIAGDPRAKGVR